MTSQKGSRFKNFDIIIFFKHNQSLYEAFAEDRMSKSLSILKINIKVCGNRHIGGQTAIPTGRRDTRSLKMPGTWQVLTKLSLFFAKTSSIKLILKKKRSISNSEKKSFKLPIHCHPYYEWKLWVNFEHNSCVIN